MSRSPHLKLSSSFGSLTENSELCSFKKLMFFLNGLLTTCYTARQTSFQEQPRLLSYLPLSGSYTTHSLLAPQLRIAEPLHQLVLVWLLSVVLYLFCLLQFNIIYFLAKIRIFIRTARQLFPFFLFGSIIQEENFFTQ